MKEEFKNKRVRVKLLSTGVTQRELADALDINQPMFSTALKTFELAAKEQTRIIDAIDDIVSNRKEVQDAE